MSQSLPLPQSDRQVSHTASAGQTAFSFDFPILAGNELLVQTRPDADTAWTTLAETTQYSVSGIGEVSGGYVTLVTGLAAGIEIRITGRAPVTSTTDVTPAGQINSKGVNRFFDRTTIWVQEIRRDATEALTEVMNALPLLKQMASNLATTIANRILAQQAVADADAVRQAAVAQTAAIKDLAVAAADAAAAVGGDAVPYYATRATAAAVAIPDARAYVEVAGVSAVGDAPTHRYERRASLPAGPLRFRDNGGTGDHFAISQPYLNTAVAGAKGDDNPASAAANRVAIQQAIDTYAFAYDWGVSPTSEGAILGNGTHYVDETIHVGWGDTYRKAVLRGVGSAYVAATAGSTIKATFSDAPVIAVQGARRSVVGGFSIIGPNLAFLQGNSFGLWGPDGDDVILENWWGPTMAASGISRYAPSAGVAIDPYSGTAPATAYPTYTVPDYLTLSSQYGRAQSSVVDIHDMDIVGTGVGIVVKPSDADGNADFIYNTNVRVSHCVIGISVGPTQARNTNMLRPLIGNVHTAFTNRLHGRQLGRWGEIIDGHVGNAIRIMDFSATAFAGPITFRNLYTECVWDIGSILSSTSSDGSLTFSESHISLDAQNIGLQTIYAGSPKKGVPAICLKTAGQVTTQFQAGNVVGYHSVLTIAGGNYGAVTVDGTRLERGSAPAALYEKIAHTALCGGLVLHNFGGASGGQKLQPKIEPKFWWYDAVSGGLIAQAYAREVWLGSRNRPTPLYIRKHAGNVDGSTRGGVIDCAPRVQFTGIVASSPSRFSCTITYSGLEATLTYSGRTEGDFMVNGPHVGDAIYSQNTSTTMYVSERSGQVVKAVLQNNFRDIGDGPIPRTTWPTTGDILYICNSRLFTTADLYFGDFTVGQNTITNVQRWDTNCFIEANVNVGDYLYTPYEMGILTNKEHGFITARSNSGQTITMGGAALKTRAGVPLGNWFAVYA